MDQGYGLVTPGNDFAHLTRGLEVLGLRVTQGDLIHADCHGALVISREVLPDLETALDKLTQSEDLVFGTIKDGRVNLEEFEAHWAAFEKART